MKTTARVWGLLVILSVCGVLLILAATSRYGAGLTPDSGCYISAARSLAAGKGFLPYSGNPFVEWPPLFPALLAVPTSLGAEPITVARYFNAAVFGLILLVSGLWLRRNVRSPLMTAVGAAALFLAVPVQEVASFAWSEPLFILLALLSLRAMQSYREEPRPRSLYMAAIAAAFACLTRYIGVTLILTAAVLILTRRKTSLRSRLIALFSSVLVSATPLAAWLVRNYWLSSTWIGERAPASSTALSKNVRYTLDNLSAWFLPEDLPVPARCLLLGLLLFLLVVALRRCYGPSGRIAFARTSDAAWPISVFLLFYSGWLVASVSSIELTILDTRYWSPVYIPLLLLLLLALDRLHGRGAQPATAPPSGPGPRKSRDQAAAAGARPRPRGLAPALVTVGCALLLAQPCWNTVRNLRFCRQYGYVGDPLLVSDGGENAQTAAQWRDSEFVAYLREHPVAGRLYTNNPVVYYLLSGSAMRLLPLLPAQQYRREYVSQELLDLQSYVRQHGPIHLAWFARSLYEVYSPKELQSFFDVRLVARKSDGAVYRLAPRPEQIGHGPRAGNAPG